MTKVNGYLFDIEDFNSYHSLALFVLADDSVGLNSGSACHNTRFTSFCIPTDSMPEWADKIGKNLTVELSDNKGFCGEGDFAMDSKLDRLYPDSVAVCADECLFGGSPDYKTVF